MYFKEESNLSKYQLLARLDFSAAVHVALALGMNHGAHLYINGIS